MEFDRNRLTESSVGSFTSSMSDASSSRPYVRTPSGLRVSIGALPSLPGAFEKRPSSVVEEDIGIDNHTQTQNDNYVEFSFGVNDKRSPEETHMAEKTIPICQLSSFEDTSIKTLEKKPLEKYFEPEEDDDFFNSDPYSWKEMKAVAEVDYYNEQGNLEFGRDSLIDELNTKASSFGYTRIDTEEQVAKYAELDRHTDFLFQSDLMDKGDSGTLGEEDDETYVDGNGSDYEDGNIQSDEKLGSLKHMLTESEKFAYAGMIKLIITDMATELAKSKRNISSRVAKKLSMSQRNFANWTMYIMSKLFDHMEFTAQEREMINKLSLHGIEVTDLSDSVSKTEAIKNPFHAKSKGNVTTKGSMEMIVDLRWTLVCDLLLLFLSDGYYDSRSRTLLILFAQYLGIASLEVYQFERRLIFSLELESKEKSIENKDELLNDRKFIEKQIKRNKNRRYAYIGLATLGGSLAIGLSAGLLAPVIGAGVAAGLTTVGITGTSSFLAGVGGSAIITTGGILTGASVGSKAGAKRTGEVQTFEFKPLFNTKRTNLIVTVSGWMNGKSDDVRLPFSTVDPVMGDMFSLYWEPEMLQSMGQTINILASEALASSIQQILGATVLTALMSAIQLPMALSKLSYLLDNPWNVSLDRAWKAGKILAETLIEGNLGVRPITLVGFSLGARLIYSCLITLANRAGYGLIENVILLGTPITVKPDQFGLARSVVSGKFISGYSKKDWVLGYLFRATSGGILTVAGLSKIENVYGIENIDCTDLVDGHMKYRKAIPKILKRINWEVLGEDFVEIEEPSAEEEERQRKLIDEFDEARAKMMNDMETTNKKGIRSFFKPMQKNWWQFYGGPDKKNKSTDDVETSPAEVEKDEAVENAGPLFNVAALQSEISQIKDLATANDETLTEVRKHKDITKPKTLNEDIE